jgi:hypothetical protein
MTGVSWRAVRLLLAAAAVLAAAGCTSATNGSTVTTQTATATTVVTRTATATVSTTATVTAPRATADFSMLRGPWSGHTRQLAISSGGVVSESVSDGCCDFQYSLTLQLSNPVGTSENARADALVLAVLVFPAYPKSAPAPPRMGDRGTVKVVDGLFTDSWFGVQFCDSKQASAGTCGA